MSFGMITWKQNMVKRQSYAIWIQTLYIMVYIKADDIYKYIAEDVETRFDTSNYELSRPIPKGKIQKVIGVLDGICCIKTKNL